MQAWMNAREAAKLLNVRPQTLYAYVSRGLLESEQVPGSRGKRYRRSDVERLSNRHGTMRNPKRVARASLDWGLPVLKSSLTMIDDGELYYRGKNATDLADHCTLESLAAELWDCELSELQAAQAQEPSAVMLRALAIPKDLRSAQHCLNAFQVMAGQHGEQVRSLNSPVARATQLLYWVRATATMRACPPGFVKRPMHQRLAAIWRLDEVQADLLRRALILCADHELNVSSFTARCVASSGASLDACVSAGLAALSGYRHGAATGAIEDAWTQWMSLPGSPATGRRQFLDSIMSAPEGRTPLGLGFGHPLYPKGDPRARALLSRLPFDEARDRLINEVVQATGLLPSVDFALVAVRRHLGLPEGSAFALFAIARVVGWLAHVFEQKKQGGLIRPRAEYIGPPPVLNEKHKMEKMPSARVVRFG